MHALFILIIINLTYFNRYWGKLLQHCVRNGCYVGDEYDNQAKMDGQKENRQTNHNKGETPQQSRANEIECYEGPQNTCVYYVGSVVCVFAVLCLVGFFFSCFAATAAVASSLARTAAACRFCSSCAGVVACV